MKVNDVIKEAIALAGREEVLAAYGDNPSSGEALRYQRCFLAYLNAVNDELARAYFPLEISQEMTSQDGVYPFADFDKKPVRINAVKAGGRPVDWHICPDCLHTDARKITVVYEYAPDRLAPGDEYSYPDPAVSERLVEYGMLAEYFLVNGDGAGFSCWEEKYRNGIDALLARRRTRGRIPPRRWI